MSEAVIIFKLLFVCSIAAKVSSEDSLIVKMVMRMGNLKESIDNTWNNMQALYSAMNSKFLLSVRPKKK